MAESNSAWENAGVVKKKRGRKRVVLLSLGAVLFVVVLVVVFLPAIASPIARSLIASKGSAAIAGSVDARGVSLSWFGPQRVTGLTLVDPGGERVADLDIAVEAGLVGLGFGGRDLGTVTIGGRIDLVEDESGRLNLERTVETVPSAGGSKPGESEQGGTLPASLHAIVKVEDLTVSYSAPALAARGVESLAAESINGRAEIRPGTDLEATLAAKIGGRQTGGAEFESGSVTASATIAGLIDAGGRIDTGAARVTAKAVSDDIDAGLADRLVDAPVELARAFASRVGVEVEAHGSLDAPSARFEIASTNVNGHGAIDLEGGALVSTEPMELTIAAAALEAVDREWLADKTGGALDVRKMPSLALRVEGVRVPTGGSSLAGASGTATVDLGAMDAVVAVGEGEERKTRRITTQPATLRVGTESLGEGAKASGSLAFTVDGREGGTLGIDITAAGILDDDGRLRTAELPVLRGTVGLDGVDTGVLQPFVVGVNLDKEVGPSLSLGLEFDAQGGGKITLITGRVASDNVNGEINLSLEGTRLAARDPGGQIRIASVGPLLTRFFTDRGLRVGEGASVGLTLMTLGVELDGAMSGGGVSLGDIDGSGEFVLGPTSGTILVDEKAHPFSIEQVGAFVDFAGSVGEVQARVLTGGTFDGEPAGQAVVELRLSDLIGAGGSLGLPSAIVGRAELIGISTAIVEPFLSADTPSPAGLIGPTVDLVVVASPTPDGKTKMVTTLTSELLTGDGSFLFSERALEVDPEEGFTLTHTGLARAVNAMVETGESVRIGGEGATASVHISRLIVPRDEQTRGMRLGETDLAARVEVRGLMVETPGEGAGETLDVRSIVLQPRLKPGEDASVRIAPTLYSGRDKLQGEGTFTIPGLMAALGGTGGWDLGSLKPTGSIVFDKVPSGLLAQGLAMARLEGVDTDALAQDIAGDAFGLTLGVRPESDGVRAEVKATGARLTLDANAVYGTGLESAGVDGEVKLSQPSAVSLMRAFLPDMAESVSVVGATALRVNGTLAPGGDITAGVRVPAMTLHGLDEADLRVGLEANATGALPVDGAAGPMTINATTTIEDAATRTRIGGLAADLKRDADAAVTGTVRADGLRTAWADRMLGTTDLYSGLLGDAVGFTGDLTRSGQTTAISARLRVPNLRDASALAAHMSNGSIVLDKPFAATWRGDRAWLNNRLARSLGEQAPAFDKDLDVVLRLRGLSLPSASGDVPLVIDALARIDALGLTMPGGESREYRQVQVVARQDDKATGVRVTARGDVRIAGGDPVRAVDLTADIHNLFGGTESAPATPYADVTGKVEHVPTSLVDALAGSDGWMTRMLGEEVSADRIAVKRAPLEGGTVAIDLSSPASSAKISGAFKDDKADGVLADGYFVLDPGGFLELTEFRESFTKKLFDVVPIFGEFERDPAEDRPSRIDIRGGRVPMGGGVEDIVFDIAVDVGSVRYGLSGPIKDVLKMTNQDAFGELGGRIQPFDVRMANGVVSYDRLTVPLGEFAFMSRGDIDVVKQVKDLYVLMPVGAFAVDAFNLQGPLAGVLDKSAVIPLNNAGPLASKQWTPDFAGAIKPGKALEDAAKQGLQQILKNRLGGGGKEGGG